MEDTTSPAAEALVRVYHFPKEKTAEVVRNPKYTEHLLEVAAEAAVAESGCEKPVGNLLYEVATAFPEAALKHRPFLCKAIVTKKVANKETLKLALNFFKTLKDGELSEETFNSACNIGVVVTKENILEAIEAVLKEKAKEVEEEKHWLEPELFKILKDRLKGGSAKDIKQLLGEKLVALFGPKPKGKKPAPKKPAEKPVEKKPSPEKEEEVTLSDAVKFPRPEENTQLRPELLEEHLKATGGRIVTRFPPEPNGYLHIGHAKALNLNFGYAKKNGGWCYLRYDDTNPEAESQEYIDSIEESVRWLGHTPYKITYASDHFDDLYNFAVQLIKKGKAYVCSCLKAAIKAARQHRKEGGEARPCEHRDRPIEENLKLFEDMKKGKFAEGEVTLRMKQDLESPNPCMWDHVAYRIKYVPHPHAGDKWCIYPAYDFTHCLCDSMENITHSLCSLEFDVRREPYNWLVDTLGIYRAPQIEYSRLNITYTVLSKRKLIQLVNDGFVKGWDDPRMPTVEGYRRRGYTPEAINNFCEIIGVTRSRNVQDIGLLEECCRKDLEDRVNREMAVLHPLRVTLVNYPENKVEMRQAPNHPSEHLNRGTRDIPFSRVLYIDANDFRMVDSANYYRLAPGKEVRLKYAYNITCTEVITDDKGHPVELKATVDLTNSGKPKGNIHWVAEPAPGVEPLAVEVRLYERLFKSAFPEGTKKEPKNFLQDLNPNSLVTIPKAYTNPAVKDMKVGDRIQFEREAYFVVDKDSTPEKLVFNRIVSLKEDKHKDD